MDQGLNFLFHQLMYDEYDFIIVETTHKIYNKGPNLL